MFDLATLTAIDNAAVPLATALAATALVAAAIGAWYRGRSGRLRQRLDESATRLSTVEVLLAETTAQVSALQKRLDQAVSRQEGIAAAAARGVLRQAIALSKHGATTRQLVDTCGLSQGEAHLVQTMYGRDQQAGDGVH